MSGLLKVGIPAAAIAIAMVVTNPKSEAYNNYASDHMVAKGEKVLCDQLGLCQEGKTPGLVKTLARTSLNPVLNSATKRQNLLFLSLYTTEVPGVGTLKSVGAFNNFFTYSES